MIRYRWRFIGLVQGVGFRWALAAFARELNITGWVENLPGDDVLAEVQGTKESLQLLKDKLMKRKFSSIEKILEEEIPLEVHETYFDIHL